MKTTKAKDVSSRSAGQRILGKIDFLPFFDSKLAVSVVLTFDPRSLDAKDAENTTVPHILLASPGEPADVVAQCKEVLSKQGKTGVVETYSTMFHGWMGARANLNNEENAKEYERGYSQVSGFFDKHL